MSLERPKRHGKKRGPRGETDEDLRDERGVALSPAEIRAALAGRDIHVVGADAAEEADVGDGDDGDLDLAAEGDEAPRRPQRERPPRMEPCRLVLRGEGYAVIDKPAGLSVLAERNRPGETPLLDEIARLLAVPEVLPVHRIDRETSGCLLVATDADTHRALCELFRARKVEKRYLALVKGAPPAEGVVEAKLEQDPRSGSFMRVVRGHGLGKVKAAKTRFRTLVRFRDVGLVLLEPVTGRQHQLRVHMSHIGHPMAVDPPYGGEAGIFLSQMKRNYAASKRKPESPLIARVTLHAWKLAFTDPKGTVVHARASLPKDFRRTLRALLEHAL